MKVKKMNYNNIEIIPQEEKFNNPEIKTIDAKERAELLIKKLEEEKIDIKKHTNGIVDFYKNIDYHISEDKHKRNNIIFLNRISEEGYQEYKKSIESFLYHELMKVELIDIICETLSNYQFNDNDDRLFEYKINIKLLPSKNSRNKLFEEILEKYQPENKFKQISELDIINLNEIFIYYPTIERFVEKYGFIYKRNHKNQLEFSDI